MSCELYAPAGYWRLNPVQKELFCNGCGANGALDVVPDTVWGLSVTEACNIHDYMYATAASTLAAKDEADRCFLNNMLRLIASAGGWLAPLRRRRARIYYEAVSHFGGPAFWKNKNQPENIGFVRG